jgi:lipopolysaccharide/colanic/teichoic acid biosynthesis glycosyltransferase
MTTSNVTVHSQFWKSVLDPIMAVLALLVLSPILIGVALLVRIFLGAPILFRQERPGFHGKPFKLYKFRTMTNARDEGGQLLPDGERLTALGRFLRRYSLDELPELLNVVKGELSLVGPRPLLMKYLPYFTEREKLRFTVKPGITGWAQIHGRNYVPWNQRLALDAWYVENWSLSLDFRILVRTALLVLKKEGVSADPDMVETDLDEERRQHAGNV